MQAARVTITSTVCCHQLPSLMPATATSFCDVASLMRVDTSALPARGVRLNRATSGSGLRSLKIPMAVTWSPSVIGLSTRMVTGTALPLSISSAISNVTLPVCSSAPPVKSLMASVIDAGVATAGRTIRTSGVATPGKEEPAPRPARDLAGRKSLAALRSLHRGDLAQRQQPGDHVLDLLRVEDRLALEGGTDTRQPIDLEVRRHDGLRVEAAGIGDAQAQLRSGRASAGAGKVGREIALEALLRYRRRMAEQAKADLAVGDDGAAARGIAWHRAGQDAGNAAVADRRRGSEPIGGHRV